MSSGERQAASRIAVGLGTALGLFYLLLVAPVTFFTAGESGSSLELAATALLLLSSICRLFSSDSFLDNRCARLAESEDADSRQYPH